MARYMFSESDGLLCRVTYKRKYYVVNGCWNGTRNGDDFVIHAPTGDRTVQITDWVEVDPTTWPTEKQQYWYFLR